MSIETRGVTPLSFLNDADSTLIPSLSVRIILGTDLYTQSSLLKEELRKQSLFNSVDDFFVIIGFSVGSGSPKLKDVSGGIYCFTQTRYQRTDSTNRSLQLDGTSYGIFLEQDLKISQRFPIAVGTKVSKKLNEFIH